MRPFMSFAGYDPANPKHRSAVRVKLNEFLTTPAKTLEAVKAKVDELTTGGDTSTWDSIVNAIMAIQEDVGIADAAWKLAFDEVDLRAVPKSSFDIVGTSSGLTFAKVRPGGRAKIYQVAGSVQNVRVDQYGGGIGFLQSWWDDQEYYKIQEQAADFRFKYSEQEAAIHYALITAIATAVSYDSTGANTAIKDVNTMNVACSTLIVNNRTALPAVNDRMNFLFYHHPNLKARVHAALNSVITDTPVKVNTYNITPVSSTSIGTGYLGQMVAPGLKNKFGRRLDLQILSETDITMRAETVVGWGRYGSYVNSAQVLRVPSS